MKQIRQRLTYANVMSSIAVFLVLGGAAIAATQLPKNSVGPKQLKKNAVTTAKIKKGAVTKAKLSASAQATLTGPTGAVGPQGPAGSALAYAHILANGEVDLPNSKNITGANVTHPEAGIYCFPGLSFTVHVVSVAPDSYGPTDGILVNPTFHGTPPYGGCGNDPRVRVTTAGAPGTPSNHPFYIVFN